MKSRKMWAHPEWGTAQNGFHAQPKEPRNRCDFVPVLVTSLEGAPDFEPGDRVRYRNENCEVIGHPFPRHELWLLPILWNCGCYELVAHDMVTKLPREKTVLLRVTGTDEYIENAISRMVGISQPCRVERVEDRDE